MTKKERKKIIILDVDDLITVGYEMDSYEVSGFKAQNLKLSNNTEDRIAGRNKLVGERTDNGGTYEPSVPCLSTIAYSTTCGCGSNTVVDSRQIESEECEDNTVNNVIILLRSSAQYHPIRIASNTQHDGLTHQPRPFWRQQCLTH